MCVPVCVCACMCVCQCACVCVCLCMCVCVRARVRVSLSPLEERPQRSSSGLECIRKHKVYSFIFVNICDLLQRYKHSLIFCECRVLSSSRLSRKASRWCYKEGRKKVSESERESEE
jgi:hypothetical protein